MSGSQVRPPEQSLFLVQVNSDVLRSTQHELVAVIATAATASASAIDLTRHRRA